jgi:hypothetical protein
MKKQPTLHKDIQHLKKVRKVKKDIVPTKVDCFVKFKNGVGLNPEVFSSIWMQTRKTFSLL